MASSVIAMQESQLIRSAASFTGRGRCRRSRRLCLALGTAVVLTLAMAQAAFAVEPPVLTGTDPVSPANNNNPKVKGTVGGDSPASIKIYTNATCTEPAALTEGSVAEFTGAGIPVTVPDDLTTEFSTKAVDTLGAESVCSNSISYVEDSIGPTTMIDSGPTGTIETTTATFTFSSNDPNATFQCSLDDVIIDSNCSSPKDLTGLSEGPHNFGVIAIDQAGNFDPGAPSRDFVVDLPPPGDPVPPPPAPPAPPASVGTSTIAARPAASFVLIAGKTINVTRKRFTSIGLNCAGSKDCAGVLKLHTARRVRVAGKRKRIVKLASTRFTIPARQTAQIRIRVSKRTFRLLRRLRRVPAMITVTDTDNAGRARTGTRVVNLRAL